MFIQSYWIVSKGKLEVRKYFIALQQFIDRSETHPMQMRYFRIHIFISKQKTEQFIARSWCHYCLVPGNDGLRHVTVTTSGNKTLKNPTVLWLFIVIISNPYKLLMLLNATRGSREAPPLTLQG